MKKRRPYFHFSKQTGQAQILIIGAVLFFGFMLTGGVVSSKFFSLAPNPSFRTDNIMVTVPPKQVTSNNGSSGNGSGGNGSGGTNSQSGGSGNQNENGGSGNNSSNGNNIQLNYFSFISPSPLPTATPIPTVNPTPTPKFCVADSGQLIAPSGHPEQVSCACHGVELGLIIDCENGQGTCIDSPMEQTTCSFLAAENNLPGEAQGLMERYGTPDLASAMCRVAAKSGNGIYCLDKPVIYLYPTQPTFINVAIQTPGKIVVSNPLYPQEGWNDVLAYPNGNLFYKDKPYTELFYESSVTHFQKPTNGITISSKDLSYQLKSIVTQLGLNQNEAEEFTGYWIPRLQNLKSQYIYFSLIDSQEKERIDHVEVTPSPTTRIEFLAYFKPIQKPLPNTLTLPATPPQRIGFTEVEWGGTIDNQ